MKNIFIFFVMCDPVEIDFFTSSDVIFDLKKNTTIVSNDNDDDRSITNITDWHKKKDRDCAIKTERDNGWVGIFLSFIQDVARTKSTCCRIKTAACIVKDCRIISIGYNGVPSKYEPHCKDFFRTFFEKNKAANRFPDSVVTFEQFLDTELFHHMHHEKFSCYEIHGEQNAIAFAAREGIATKDTSMFTLYSPCFNCAKLIISAGITKVYYHYEYGREIGALDFLQENNILVFKI